MKNKYLSKILIIVLIVMCVYACILFVSKSKDDESVVDEAPIITEVIEEEVIEEEIEEEIVRDDLYDYIELYDTNKEINPDYAGQIIFESGIINEPFVYSKNNNDYLRKNFRTGKYDVMGTIFMDYECKLNSQNIVLYGHYAYSYFDPGYDEDGNKLINEELMFTPLELLKSKEKYDENKNVLLVQENEIRQYVVCAVYYSNLTNIDGALYPNYEQQYYLPEYSNDYFNTYKRSIENNKLYDTGVEYDNSDDFLTLQTCVENAHNSRQIVLCKYVGKIELDRNGYEKYLEKIAE